VTRNT